MPDEFNPRSTDSMFATLIAQNEAFRIEVRERFNSGTRRMDAQDCVLAEIKAQTQKTNGRVTRLEQGWKLVTAKAVGAIGAITVLYKTLLWLVQNGISAP